MAKQEILISINLRGAGEASDGVNKLRRDYSKLTDEELKLLKVERERVLQNREIVAGIDQEIIATNAKANATKAARTQSGLNNAILLETSRLASDASYGFTAIANNLSQVVSLFQSFVKTNGGVIASFKELSKSIIGTGGIMIAIQLLISFGPQIFDFFMRLIGHSKNLREAMKDAAGEVESTAGNFETYIRTLQDSTKSQEEQNDAIEALNKEFPNYIKQLEDANVTLKDVADNTDEAKKQNNLYRESIVKLAMARAAQNKIDELAAKKLQEEIDVRTKALEKYGFSAEKVAEIEKRYGEISIDTTLKGRGATKARENAMKVFTAEERRIIKLTS